MIKFIILPGLNPREDAASVWPFEMANIPERTISPIKADVYNERAKVSAIKEFLTYNPSLKLKPFKYGYSRVTGEPSKK